MPVNRILSIVSGIRKWVTPITTSAGVGDALKPINTNASGVIDITLLPGGLANVIIAVASEALSAGDAVNLWDDAGTTKLRKADADGGVSKKTDGFVIAAFALGATATAYKDGSLTGLAGLTPGVDYFTSTAAGGITSDPSGYTAAGQAVQRVGKAQSASVLQIQIDSNPGENE